MFVSLRKVNKMGRRRETTEYLKDCIADAFIEKLRRKPFDKINVQEITDLAKVGRMTYFRNFKSKEELLIYRLNGLWEKKKQRSPFPHDRGIYEQAYWFFSFCEDEKDLLKLISEHKKTNILLDFFKQCVLLPSPNSSKERYLKAYQAYGMTGIVTDWIEHGCVEDTETLARLCSE